MKEEEIRPKTVFDEYIRLATLDVAIFFQNIDRESINCYACDSRGNFAFAKSGFNYDVCPNCSSIYVNPRPSMSTFSKYYTESESAKYWATTYYKETAEARREKIWKPKAQSILALLNKYAKQESNVYDIGGGYGIFAEEMTRLNIDVTLIEPSPFLATICREKGLKVIQLFLEDIEIENLANTSKTFVSFELFEHLHNPETFLKKMFHLMEPDDFFIFTTLSGSGVDIQALWNHSKSIMPPYHLNFFNPYSVKLFITERSYNAW